MSETTIDSREVAEKYIDNNRELLISDLSERIDAGIKVGLQQVEDGNYSSMEDVFARIQKDFFS